MKHICEYDLGTDHETEYTTELCERCKMVRGVETTLCNSCGYHMDGMKLCNICYLERDIEREREWVS